MIALCAQPVLAAAESIVTRRLGRLDDYDDPRIMWLVVALAAAAAAALVVWQYRRESVSLPRGAAVLLAGLRMVAIAGAIVFYLNPTKRTDQQEIAQSRITILVDASQSMAVADESAEGKSGVTRSAAAVGALRDSSLLAELRKEHDVTLTAFDAEERRIVEWPRLAATSETPSPTTADQSVESPVEEKAADEHTPADWSTQLPPIGAETRLGDALAATLARTEGGPLAGVILLSDGGQTGGVDPLALADEAARRRTPVLAIGLGSIEPRKNARIQELIAPPRAYPEDKLVVRVVVQGEELAGQSVDVELYAREGDAAQAAAVRLGRQTASFDERRESIELDFDLEPAAAGRLELEARIVAPIDDQYAEDDVRGAEIEVVETNARVLLVASGATRDYRFLRNQLRRDKHAAVDVLLQGSLAGISQDADKILKEFPSTKEELYQYDCLAAFDVDWTQLDAAQVDMLEQWVAEEAGGMIVVAGPIHMPAWIQSPEHGKIRALYPVEFQQRLTLLDDGLFGSKTPWPLEFTRTGAEADFLWLGDTPEESRIAWSRFPGVYGCYAAKGPKPGAQVYAHYSDPDAGIAAGKPVYFADHFYGAGRVFYMGSGELWRLRAASPAYFEMLTTQLVRHVSQGRLLRGSSLGRLLAERDRYYVGDTVVLRAQLSSTSREPFVAPQVTARVIGPGDSRRNVTLAADATRAGNFVGQFTPEAEGSYRVELAIPEAPDEVLSKRITVTVPDLEFADTRQNRTLLESLTARTGGRYYAGVAQAVDGGEGAPPLATLIKSRSETKILRGEPDKSYTERVNQILLAVIAGALCLEWLGRRLLKLA